MYHLIQYSASVKLLDQPLYIILDQIFFLFSKMFNILVTISHIFLFII